MDKYQELLEKIEEVRTGENNTMLVNPLINFAESFCEITKQQADQLRDLLAKNHQEHEENLAKEQERTTELETVLEQIKEGKMTKVDRIRKENYQHLNDDDEWFINRANQLVAGIEDIKETCRKWKKKYSLNDPRENANWQEWITQNSKNDDQKSKLEDILNYWKSQERETPNNPNHESNGEKFPLVPVIIGGSVLVIGIIILILILNKKSKKHYY